MVFTKGSSRMGHIVMQVPFMPCTILGPYHSRANTDMQ